MSLVARLRRLGLAISPRETDFARRGFPSADPHRRAHLERMAASFVEGFNLALYEPCAPALTQQLDAIEPLRCGFAYEGAAMALAILDAITPWNRCRLAALLDGPGQKHVYMVHVGVGWAAARVPWLRASFPRYLRRFDPLYRWLAADGYGFHEGYFHWRACFEQLAVPPRLSGYTARAFDQGLGRSLWFVGGANVASIAERIDHFPRQRQCDLYSGVGLACTYAGGASQQDIERLAVLCGEHRAAVAQGAAFAAKARLRAGHVPDHTETACEALAGISAAAAAAITDEALATVQPEKDENAEQPAYELWRQRIQSRLFSGHISASKC
jgi:hypothetical protein